jgi:hypothetical protein
MAFPSLSNAVVASAPDGAIGFDVNHPITAKQAKSARQAGFQFCVRYVPRLELALEPLGAPDITFQEANAILDSGLAIVLVQHVSSPGWLATGAKGLRFGKNAAIYAVNCGFPQLRGSQKKVNIFLDLEEVSSSSTPAQIVDYCKEWFDAVDDAGYAPGVYVGSNNGLNAELLFSKTAFRHYWHAASQADPPKPRPGDRGYQLDQPLKLSSDQLAKLNGVKLLNPSAGNAFECDLKFDDGQIIKDVDLDIATMDKKNGQLQWLVRQAV